MSEEGTEAAAPLQEPEGAPLALPPLFLSILTPDGSQATVFKEQVCLTPHEQPIARQPPNPNGRNTQSLFPKVWFRRDTEGELRARVLNEAGEVVKEFTFSIYEPPRDIEYARCIAIQGEPAFNEMRAREGG